MKFKEHASEGSGTFLKIEDGQSVKGIFVGDIYEFYTKWDSGKSSVTNESDPDGKIRFRCNFLCADESGELAAKIWEFPLMIYNYLKEINEEYPLEETKVKITRKGTGTKTEYTIMPLVSAKEALKPDQLKVIKQMPLLKLDKKASANYAPSSEPENTPENWT